jgi:hypothetical protein
MRSFQSLLIIAGMSFFASCGPSAEEQAAAEKHVQDSISAAKVQMEAAREAARQQQIDDSTSAMDSTTVPAN